MLGLDKVTKAVAAVHGLTAPCPVLQHLRTRPCPPAPQAIVHSGWIDLQGRLVSNYDPTQDKPVAFDLDGVNRQATVLVGRVGVELGAGLGTCGGQTKPSRWPLIWRPHPCSFCLSFSCRNTWLAAKREPWTPQRHRQWPPRFQAAVQHLLLLHHTGRAGRGEAEGGGGPLTRGKRARLDLAQRRATTAYPTAPAAAAEPAATAPQAVAAGKAGGSAAGSRPSAQRRGLKRGRAAAGAQAEPRELAPLASLPKELLLRIVAEAAYPISAWV